VSVWGLGASYGYSQSMPTSYVNLTGPLSVPELTSHMEVYHDKDWSTTIQDLIEVDSVNFVPIERENFLQYYSVYLHHASGEIETIEVQTPETKFSDRLINYPELVTPIRFEPGEMATLYIAYWSQGSSNAAIALETQESFSQKAVARTSKNYVFYGMVALLIVSAFLGFVFLKQRVFSAYLFYVMLILVYLMHVDGVTFQYFWPQLPLFNSYFSIIIGLPFVMATYNFARIFLQTKRYHPRADRVMFWMCALTPCIIVPLAFFDAQMAKKIIMPFVLIAILTGVIVGIVAARTRFKFVRFYLFAWMCGITSASIMNMRHIFGFDIAQDTEFDSIRVSLVVDSIMMGMAVIDGYIQTRKHQEKAAQDSLVAAQENLKLNQRLFDLEQQYQLAEEMAVSRDESLRNTIHDLRQPLHALRMSVQLPSGESQRTPENSEQIGEMFSYLENLLSKQLKTAITSPVNQDQVKKSEAEEEMGAQKILKSVHEMFLPDALVKGVDFRFVPSRHDTVVDPFVLIRILNNLVSNAIKYTPTGKILLGSRRMADGLRIEIHDTGIGMSAEDFALAKERDVRLKAGEETADGEGLGLSIAADLAEANGYKLYLAERKTSGTSIILDVPVKQCGAPQFHCFPDLLNKKGISKCHTLKNSKTL